MVRERNFMTGPALEPHDRRQLRVAGLLGSNDLTRVHVDLRTGRLVPVNRNTDPMWRDDHPVDGDVI